MSVSADELEKYVSVMRDKGVANFKSGDLEITLGPKPAEPLKPRDPDAPIPPPRKTEYERLLFACTEGIPEEDDQ